MKYLSLLVGFILVCIALTNAYINASHHKRVPRSTLKNDQPQDWVWSDGNQRLTYVNNFSAQPSTTREPSTTSKPLTTGKPSTTSKPSITSTTATSVAEYPCPYYSNKPNFTKPGRRISEAKCLEYIWERSDRVNMKKEDAECFRNWYNSLKDKPDYVIGGRITLPGEFPHMGAVGWRMIKGTWIFKCGCTLISPKFTLTAAHCSKSPSDSKLVNQVPEIVRLGDKNIIDVSYMEQDPIDARILRIIVHPLYSAPKKYYDIALIELVESRKFAANVQPACLWTQFNTDRLGTSATLTGWGVIETATRQVSPELQAAVVDIIDSQLCDLLLKPSCNRHWCGLQDHQICAGKLSGGVDACQGDSGGPLQVKIPLNETQEGSMHFVIGVTAFGIGCARSNLPGVYTRVSSFIDWIEPIVWPENQK